MALITLDDVSKIYPKGTRPALDGVTVAIDRGDFVFLVGASGSGKTTLLSLLLREEDATAGEIRVAGNDLRRLSNRQVPQYRRSIGFIFQDYKLLNNKTVWQNVAFALEVIGTGRSTIKSLVPKVLETVGLTGKENNYPHELSGGEAQRVAIARAYVNHPQILLADEPTGNLDPTTSLGIMEVLDAINRTGTTIVMATHNEEIVNSMRKRVVELHNGKLVRDEASGSYDSALFFPDSEVESKAKRGIVSDARFRPGRNEDQGEPADAGRRGIAAVHTVEKVTEAIQTDSSGDAGIARLANAVHSGRTGRYGEAFRPAETTMTWGKGLNAGAAGTAASGDSASGEGTAQAGSSRAEPSSEPGERSTDGHGTRTDREDPSRAKDSGLLPPAPPSSGAPARTDVPSPAGSPAGLVGGARSGESTRAKGERSGSRQERGSETTADTDSARSGDPGQAPRPGAGKSSGSARVDGDNKGGLR